MPICRDPLVNHLKKEGLNVVYPPRENLAPLELMLRTGRQLVRWGDTSDAFDSTYAVPEIEINAAVPNLFKSLSATHDLSIGLSLLSTLLGQAGGKALGLKTAYKDARKLVFSYDGITRDSCDPLKIDKYLNSGQLTAGAVSTSKYLKSDSLYVVAEVYKTAKLSVSAVNESGASIDVDVPEIQLLNDAKVSVSVDKQSEHKLIYQGNTPLTFGVRAFKIDYVSKSSSVEYHLVKASSKITARKAVSSSAIESKNYQSLSGGEAYDFE